MGRKKIHEISVGTACSVRVYRDAEFGEYIVKAVVKGKPVGGKGGGYHTDDKADAYATAGVEATRLGNRPACRVMNLSARRSAGWEVHVVTPEGQRVPHWQAETRKRARQEMRSLRAQGIPKGVRVVLQKKPRP